jgi:signal transduction histidine kinase
LDGRSVVTTVSDRGPGVRAEDRDRIFDRFVQVRGSGGRTTSGVGLGLFLARRATEAMGGELWCADAPGGGAAFAFTLPAG